MRDADAPSKDGEAPEKAKRRGSRRNRRGRGRSGGAHGSSPQPLTNQRVSGDAEAAPTRQQPGGGARRRGGRIFGALDLGTNNCRLLIARAEGESFKIIDSFSRAIRLGEGLEETGALSEQAIDRCVAALSVCAARLAKHRAVKLRAIATEACRRASNSEAFLRRVRDETGIELIVVAAEEEARLAVAGCAPLLDPMAEELLVFDIGGGSTELIWMDLSRSSPAKRRSLLMALAHGESRSDRARAAARHVRDWISTPLGVVTLGEAFRDRPDDEARFRLMQGEMARRLTAFLERNGPLTPERLARLQVLGASGTITTLAGVYLDLQRYSRKAVDGLWVDRAPLEDLIERLAAMTPAERRRIPCVGEDRAENLMCGAAILLAILQAWPTQKLRVADRGLREGMLYGLIQDDRARRGSRRRQRRRGAAAKPQSQRGSGGDNAPSGEAAGGGASGVKQDGGDIG